MAATADLLTLDALGPSGAYRTHERQTISDVTGAPMAELCLVPRLFVTRTMAALHRASPLPVDVRVAAIAHAGEHYARDAGEHEHRVSRATGLPITVVREATALIARSAAAAYSSAEAARPAATVTDWRDPLTRMGRGVWTRRGEVFAVLAPGNEPGVHALWLEALALGYRVAVRPSARDPFTPHRLVTALRTCGLPEDQVVLLPAGHDVADELVRTADLAMVFGGEELMRKYAGRPSVLPQGPGRSKILVTADVDWREHLDVIAGSVVAQAGRACTSASAVFVEGDPEPLAQALAQRLAGLLSLPPTDECAVLPVAPVAEARRLETRLLAAATGTRAWLGGDGIVDELGDGSAVLRPAVHQLARPDAPQARVELAFPCVWVAPWTRAAGLAPLRDTLVLTAITGSTSLVDALVAHPAIGNVHVGDRPTTWYEPGLPHDGYLGELLMKSTAVVRG
jgi:acyl-CoA reductase-like NAD-dependent aldehyde dehydrogenase